MESSVFLFRSPLASCVRDAANASEGVNWISATDHEAIRGSVKVTLSYFSLGCLANCLVMAGRLLDQLEH